MKKILLCLLLPLGVFAQRDSLVNFYAQDSKMTWELKYKVLGKDASTIKQQLIEQLEGVDGIEILNNSNPDLIRGRIRGIVETQKKVMMQNYQVTCDSEFRIMTKHEGYEVKLSSIFSIIKSQSSLGGGGVANKESFEQTMLKRDGRIRQDQKKALERWNGLFLEIFKLKTE